jgi:hypothetical protein
MTLNGSIPRVAMAFLVPLFATRPGLAQEMRIVSGTVTDSGGRTVSYVTLDGGAKYRAITNAVGEFRLQVPQNLGIEVQVRRIGFLPTRFKVEPGTDTTIRVPMQQLAVLMNTQIIRAQQQVRTLELRGFYERMLETQNGALNGDYVLPEEIEMRSPNRVSQLLETKRGVTVRRQGGCNIIVTCFRVYGQGGCAATIYLDGQRLNQLATASSDLSGAPAVDELIPVSSVSGIEVYPRGALAPSKFQSLGGSCAIVLIWTK